METVSMWPWLLGEGAAFVIAVAGLALQIRRYRRDEKRHREEHQRSICSRLTALETTCSSMDGRMGRIEGVLNGFLSKTLSREG